MKEKWSSKSLGNRWQHQFFYFLIKIGSWPAGYIALFFVVTAYCCIPTIRERSRPYIERRFPNAGPILMLLHYWRHQWSFGKVLVDRATTGIRGLLSVEATQEDVARLQKLHAQGRGLLLLSAHVGCWQTSMIGLGTSLGTVINVLLHKDELDVDRHYNDHGGIKVPFVTINADDGAYSLIQVSAALQRGEVVVAMADRTWGKEHYMTHVPFLGGEISLPWGLHYLAAVCQTPVAICYAFRKGPCRVHYSIAAVQNMPEPSGKNAGQYLPFLQEFAATLEAKTQEWPYQFFNFYNMWETQ
jgi:Predicted acyltransferase